MMNSVAAREDRRERLGDTIKPERERLKGTEKRMSNVREVCLSVVDVARLDWGKVQGTKVLM
jgi:hypothetical protein